MKLTYYGYFQDGKMRDTHAIDLSYRRLIDEAISGHGHGENRFQPHSSLHMDKGRSTPMG